MILNLNKPFIGLDGKELTGSDVATMSVFLANALANSNKPECLKLWHWALALYAGKEITIDEADRDTLLRFVSEHPTFTVLARAQLQTAINLGQKQ